MAAAQYNSSSRSANGVVLPAGTEIAIQTNEAIDSKTGRVGQTYNAQVAQDVMGPSGEVLIPKGSDASLILRQASSGGRPSGPDLPLAINSVAIPRRRSGRSPGA